MSALGPMDAFETGGHVLWRVERFHVHQASALGKLRVFMARVEAGRVLEVAIREIDDETEIGSMTHMQFLSNLEALWQLS